MPEFCIIIARKIFSRILGGMCPPAPRLLRLWFIHQQNRYLTVPGAKEEVNAKHLALPSWTAHVYTDFIFNVILRTTHDDCSASGDPSGQQSPATSSVINSTQPCNQPPLDNLFFTHCLKKTVQNYFCQNFCQISTNYKKFLAQRWQRIKITYVRCIHFSPYLICVSAQTHMFQIVT